MNLLRYLVVFSFVFLTHCGGNKKPARTIAPKPTLPAVTTPSEPRTHCYSVQMPIVDRDLYRGFVEDSLGGRGCSRSGRSGYYSWNLNIGPDSCDEFSRNAPTAIIEIESGYKKAKRFTLLTRGANSFAVPFAPIHLGDAALSLADKDRGWRASFTVSGSSFPGSYGGEIELYCERCEFDDLDREMDIEVRYRSKKMGTISITPERKSSSKQCEQVSSDPNYQ